MAQLLDSKVAKGTLRRLVWTTRLAKPKHAATHKKLRAKDRPLANDFVSDEAFDQLLDDWLATLPESCYQVAVSTSGVATPTAATIRPC